MTRPISLTVLWHQHQPYYPDDVSGYRPMPWVRLHGTKAYYGMALLLKEIPEFRCTINLVPSLLQQIQQYVEGGTDLHLDLSRIPAEELTEVEQLEVLKNFFLCNPEQMIAPHSRYAELYHLSDSGHHAPHLLPRFDTQAWRDLQVWGNLTWFHPLAIEADAELKAFFEKGRDWSEDEKLWLLEKQREILARIIPLHRELQDAGQIEITTTPFFHPILPLLIDKTSAREAMPDCELPHSIEPWVADAREQIQRAVTYYKACFGREPVGMWPAEGSVSQAMVQYVSAAGFEWMAGDEEVLEHSLSTDNWNRTRDLYRPWNVTEQQSKLQMVFRDHELSDLIGFHYQRNEPHTAARDLISRIEQIGNAAENNDRPALVPIILDGENCWEYYREEGVPFLREFYRQVVEHPSITPMRVCDTVRKEPATDNIPRLFAGSWIAHNFAIWIGHQEDRTGWDRLNEAREVLVAAEAAGTLEATSLAQAREELLIAQGSDWFWWYGDDHNSGQDDVFDFLFRRHLKNVYTLLGQEPPAILDEPISAFDQQQFYTHPTGFVRAETNGAGTFLHWNHAGYYQSGNQRGTMTLATVGAIRDFYFGFDETSFHLRLDTADHARNDLPPDSELHITHTTGPAGGSTQPTKTIVPLLNTTENQNGGVRVGIDRVVEISLPLGNFGYSPGEELRFSVELFANNQSIDRAPAEGNFTLIIPSPDFEQHNWQV